jgi:receptor expression-enhancing protein 5/6
MSEALTKNLDRLRSVGQNGPFANYLALMEEKLNMPFENVLVGAGVLVLALVFFGFGAPLITNLVGFLFPVYASLYSIESGSDDERKKWLVYFLIYNVFATLESFCGGLLAYWVPLYFPMKLVLLVSCMIPEVNAGPIVFDAAIKPVFRMTEDKIDALLREADANAPKSE